MMEAAWRPPARTEVKPDWMADWMEPFARTIDAAKKYVVSSTLDRVDWNAELVRGDLGEAVREAAIVFFSMATSSSEDIPRNVEFLYSRNRLNVAVSRARCLAVLVASPRL